MPLTFPPLSSSTSQTISGRTISVPLPGTIFSFSPGSRTRNPYGFGFSGLLLNGCLLAPVGRRHVAFLKGGLGAPKTKKKGIPKACEGSMETEAPVSVSVERVTFRNANGEELVGIWEEPEKEKEFIKKEVVILCHGFRSSKKSSTLASVAASLHPLGITTLRFDFNGNGESAGQFSYGGYWREVEDIQAAVRYVREREREGEGEGEEGWHVAAIVGHSKGGSDVILYASLHCDVTRVVNLSGRYDLRGGVRERLGEEGMRRVEEEGRYEVRDRGDSYVVTREALADRLSTDLPSALSSLSPLTRILTIHGSMDSVVPVADARLFHSSIPNHRLVILQNGDHSFQTCRDQLASHIIHFITGE